MLAPNNRPQKYRKSSKPDIASDFYVEKHMLKAIMSNAHLKPRLGSNYSRAGTLQATDLYKISIVEQEEE